MSSPASAITPMSDPTGAFPPAGTRIFRSTPAPMASISMLALSVSISASTSPTLTASPSFLFHLTMVPSSMVGESFASTTLVTVMVIPSAVEDLSHGLHHPVGLGHEGLLQRLGVRHGHVGGGHADDGGVQGVEALPLHAV